MAVKSLSAWQRIGVVISVLWLVGLPIYLMINHNRHEQEFLSWCVGVGWERNNFLGIVDFISPMQIARIAVAGDSGTKRFGY